MGPQGAEASTWYVSCAENGWLNNYCSTACSTAANATGASLHVSSSPFWVGDLGAAYEAGGFCGLVICVGSNSMMQSPVINCTGRTNMTLAFTYIEAGGPPNDDASVWYNAGSGWNLLVNTPPTVVGCAGGQGRWTNYSIALPAICNNNANVRIGFLWVNNDDGLGSDPSFAVDNVTISVPVSSPPTPAFAASNDTVCKGNSLTYMDMSTGSPTSWQWTFNGGFPASHTGQFPPSILYMSAGTFTTKLVVSNGFGLDSTTQTITVVTGPAPSFSGIPSINCINSNSYTINASPSGGTFSGPGMSGSTFSPSVAGVGTHSIRYNVSDAFGCTGSTQQVIRVDSLPAVSMNPPTSPVCLNDTSQTLSGVPSGGTFAGNGVSGTTFNPTTAGAGTHSITYSYTNPTSGCSNTANRNITVNASPIATFLCPVDTICTTDAPFNLSGGSPAGGTYSGNGVTGISFDPGAGSVVVGWNVLEYTFTDAGTSCKGIGTDSIFVEVCVGRFENESNVVKVYPNPSQGLFMLESPHSGTWEVYSLDGRKIAGGSFSKGKQSLDLTGKAKGEYLLKLNATSETQSFMLRLD